ncbi:Gfo/Idh/MocA family oxidoreductase [Schleiferiaceae bacterium]|nr:Gfo/Idh/MocA family oxidoreductase [Schleiferiaceae bacterium]
MKNFALIGASGYIAPRHLQAIKETNNNLLCAYDPYDGVGIMDSYFPNSDFFTEFERFDRHIDKQQRLGNKIEYVSVCSPNYLHDSHIRFGLRSGANVICEKPLVLNPWNIDALQSLEQEYGYKINTILQLRLHKDIIKLKNQIDSGDPNKIYDIDLTYLTSRGKWYFTSWKGDEDKSGGIATNIGVHFFDMLTWIFGDIKGMKVHLNTHDRASGYLELTRARVRWFLSVNYDLIPEDIKAKGQRTFRSISVDGNELEFSSGFTDLHSKSYEAILDNRGFSIIDTRQAVEIVHNIRESGIDPIREDYHPFAKLPLTKHPFR